MSTGPNNCDRKIVVPSVFYKKVEIQLNALRSRTHFKLKGEYRRRKHERPDLGALAQENSLTLTHHPESALELFSWFLRQIGRGAHSSALLEVNGGEDLKHQTVSNRSALGAQPGRLWLIRRRSPRFQRRPTRSRGLHRYRTGRH